MSENFNILRVQDLVNNPTPRVPVVLCLDFSGSMGAVEDDGTLQDTGEQPDHLQSNYNCQ